MSMAIIDKYGDAACALGDALGGTDYVSKLENALSAELGKSVIATSSADGALHTALHLCGMKSGDYVFIPSFAFYSHATTVKSAGGVPVFLDCDPITRCLSAQALETAFVWAELQNKPPVAVIADDSFGSIPDFDVLLPMCKARGVPVIETACDALFGSYNGKPCGALGDMGVLCFSKRTGGSGGAVVCGSDEMGAARRFIRAEYSDGESHDYKMNGVTAALDYGLLPAAKRISDGAKKNLADLSKSLDVIAPPVSGDAGAYALIKADVAWITERGYKVKRIPPTHTLPEFSEFPFFEHEPGFAVCNTFANYTLVDMDMSLIKRIKLKHLLSAYCAE